MTPTGFMIQHREIVLALATNNTLAEAWRLLVQRLSLIHI